MRCEKVQEKLPAYLDASLGWLTRRRIGAHLHECAVCQREKEALERTVNLLHNQEIPLERIPRDITKDVMSAIAKVPAPVPAPRARMRRPVVLVPATLAAAAALALPLLLRDAPAPPAPTRPNSAYIQEYAQFRAEQEISGSSGMFVLASELTKDAR